MKNFKLILSIAILLVSIIACDDQEQILTDEQNEKPFKSVALSQKAKTKVSNFGKKFNSSRLSGENVQFDFDNSYAIQGEESNFVTIVVPQLGEASMKEKYAIGFYENESQISSSPMIIKTTTPVDGYAQIEYYNEAGTLLSTFNVNQNDETVTLTYKYTYSVSGRTAECGNGDEVLECVLDAYEGHGWYSVGLFVGTLFAPEIGLIVVGACGLSTCV